jgi:protein-disulfide isomerase
MSSTSRSSFLDALSERKVLLLAIPTLLVLAALLVIGRQSEKAPAPLAAAGVTQPASPITTATSSQFSDGQRQAIGQIIKEYLISNPEVFIEVQGALEAKLEKENAERLKVAIAENAEDIFRHPNAAVAGDPDGDITVVEFFDYNCGYCKRGLADVVKLVESDPKVRVVFKELPILSKGSAEAARVALAARNQGKYWELHRALLKARGQANEASALKLAEELGLDMEQLKADMESDEVKAEIAHSEALAKKMGVNGTPHFLIGDRSIPGAPEDLYEQLSTHVNELRKQGCSFC